MAQPYDPNRPYSSYPQPPQSAAPQPVAPGGPAPGGPAPGAPAPAGPAPAPPPPGQPQQPAQGQPQTAEQIRQQVDTTLPTEQFQAYINEGHLDTACPPDRPFRQDKAHIDKWFGGKGYDPNACVEKPTDQVGDGGGGGGGGRGGRGRGGTGPGGVKGKANQLWDEINNLQSRFSPEVMQRLIAGAKASGATAGKRAGRESDLEFIKRGMGRSADAAIASEAASRGAEAGVVNPAVTSYTAEKVNADQEDRIQKLQAMQNWINSSRQYILGSQANQNQKMIALANLDLQQQRLSQELQMQQNSFDFTMANNAWNQVRY